MLVHFFQLLLGNQSSGRGEKLDTERILEALRDERDRLDRAIAVLQGGSRSSAGRSRASGKKRRGPRRMSAEARRRISEAQKKRWEKVKKAAKKS